MINEKKEKNNEKSVDEKVYLKKKEKTKEMIFAVNSVNGWKLNLNFNSHTKIFLEIFLNVSVFFVEKIFHIDFRLGQIIQLVEKGINCH